MIAKIFTWRNLAITLLLLVAFRAASYIPTPAVDVEAMTGYVVDMFR